MKKKIPLIAALVYLMNSAVLLAADKYPARIASLSLASDEVLVDLIPLCGGLQRIIALSTLVDEPSMSSITDKAHQIRGRVHSEPESLFALKPDLVIGATFNRPELLKMTESRKIPLLTLSHFTSADDIGSNIEKIGTAIGCLEQAKSMKKNFLKRVQPITLVANPQSLLLFDSDLVIMGSETLFDDLVKRAGGINAAAAHGIKAWPKLDSESLITMNPDAIVVLKHDSPELRANIRKHPAWGKLPAVKNQKFIFLKSRTAQSTSHYFADGVEELRTKLKH